MDDPIHVEATGRRVAPVLVALWLACLPCVGLAFLGGWIGVLALVAWIAVGVAL